MLVDEDYVRKWKVEVDFFIIDLFFFFLGVGSVRLVFIEDNEGVYKGGSLI